MHSPLRQLRASSSSAGRPNADAPGRAACTPPVFIVVCNNTNVSKLVFDYIAGWSKTLADGTDGRRARRSCRSSATSTDGRLVAAPEHASSSTASSSSPARR